MNHETCTMADADRIARERQRDPAAVAYGRYLREKDNGRDPIKRETERVRLMMQVCTR